MEANDFERWVLTRANQGGYISSGTAGSWDKGADGIIKHKETGQKFILQCKHSGRETIPEHEVIEGLLTAREAYDSDTGLIALTNSYFSKPIVKRMNELGIRYFDRETICTWPRL